MCPDKLHMPGTDSHEKERHQIQDELLTAKGVKLYDTNGSGKLPICPDIMVDICCYRVYTVWRYV